MSCPDDAHSGDDSTRGVGRAWDIRTNGKTHLQKLFQKTDTGRQADLMRLAMSALAQGTGPGKV
jgi:hypothetical protein